MSRPLFVTGAGGVGKTTMAGALAVSAARTGIRTLVVTVDPARRLAQALGLDQLGNEPVGVDTHLDAAMLDAAASWEALVRRHTDEATAERLIASPFFRAIADRFPGGQSYAVAEETAEVLAREEYELVVVDTPPVGGGVDFFEAPRHIRRLVAGRALRLLTGPPIPGRRVLFKLTARPALRLADRVLGGPLLSELGSFLVDLRTTYDGIRRRAAAVERLLDRSPSVVVTTPDPGPVTEAEQLLATRRRLIGVLLNRIVPSAWIGEGDSSGDAYEAALHRWGMEAMRHRAVRETLTGRGADVVGIEWLPEPPTSLDELHRLAERAGLADLLRRAGVITAT